MAKTFEDIVENEASPAPKSAKPPIARLYDVTNNHPIRITILHEPDGKPIMVDAQKTVKGVRLTDETVERMRKPLYQLTIVSAA